MRYAPRIAALVLLALAALHVVAALRYPLGSDPSLFQYHAWAMTQGVMPYRDSLEFNSPGIILLHAGFTWLFGFGDAAFIGFALVVSAVVAGLGVRWVAARTSREAALVAAAAALLAFTSITPWDRGQRELFQGAFFGAAALVATGGPGLWRALGAGVLAGLAVLIKWPFVAVVWPAWALWLFFGRGLGGSPVARALVSGLGFAAAVGAGLGWLAGNDALTPFLSIQRLVLPAHLGAMNATWGELLWGRWPLGVLALALLGLVAANRPARSPSPRPTAPPALVLGFIALFVVGLYALQRKGWSYQLHTVLPFVAPLVGLAFHRLVPAARALPLALGVVAAIAAQALVTTAYDLGTGMERAHRVGGHWDHDAMEAVVALLDATPRAPEAPPGPETVLTNDDELQLLLMARRLAATPFLYGFLTSEAHPDPDLKRLARERVDAVHRDPPDWVLWNTQPFRPELDTLEANPMLRSVLGRTCRELFQAPAPYRVFRCKGMGSEPSLDGGRLLRQELTAP